MTKGIVGGVCLVCGYKGGLMAVREYRGNTFGTDLLCGDCYERRVSHGGTCASCVYFDRSEITGRTSCLRNMRMVMRGDRCGSWEERPITKNEKDTVLSVPITDAPPTLTMRNGCKVYVGAKALHIKKGAVCEIVIEDGADVSIKTVRRIE